MNEIYVNEDEYPILYEMVETEDYTDEDLDNLAEFCREFLKEYNVLVEKVNLGAALSKFKPKSILDRLRKHKKLNVPKKADEGTRLQFPPGSPYNKKKG